MPVKTDMLVNFWQPVWKHMKIIYGIQVWPSHISDDQTLPLSPTWICIWGYPYSWSMTRVSLLSLGSSLLGYQLPQGCSVGMTPSGGRFRRLACWEPPVPTSLGSLLRFRASGASQTPREKLLWVLNLDYLLGSVHRTAANVRVVHKHGSFPSNL